MHALLSEADLVARLSDVVQAAGGTITRHDAQTLQATLTAITSQWFLGGRKATDSVTCRLVPDAHEVHLRETATETSWGLPPPALTFETTTQRGARVTTSRTEKAAGGGGGRLEFGRFRDAVEKATREAGWQFVYDAP